jgi:beta-fructofuranosidase
MLRLPDAWLWDFWLADDGDRYHLFFLFASRALQDERRRHRRASIGHAVSDDLQDWTQLSDALAAADGPAFDDVATWTGSVMRGHDDRWWLFYTGVTMVDGLLLQTVGAATSADLEVWHKQSTSPLVTADERWYERVAERIRPEGDTWYEEAWRDPWVFPDPGGGGWHMLLTARANHGLADDRGVIGHAVSADLRQWEVRPPLSEPGSGFGHLEVPQVAAVDGRPVLLFSCLEANLSAARRATGTTGGIWYVPAASPTGPFEVAAARPLTDHSLYAGRLVQDRAGQPALLAFRYYDQARQFVGELTDPMPVGWENGELTVIGSRHEAAGSMNLPDGRRSLGSLSGSRSPWRPHRTPP